MVKSGSVDLLAAMKYLVSQGLVKSTDVPTNWSTASRSAQPAAFPLTGLTFNLS